MKTTLRVIGAIALIVILFFVLRPAKNSNQEFSIDFLLNEELVTYFVEELEDPIIEKLGQPIEGFTPAILTSHYTGLSIEDFDKAEALQGQYEYKNGTLEFIFTKDTIPHSAADTLTQDGMKTLLLNIATRNEVVVDSKSEIDDLIDTL